LDTQDAYHWSKTLHILFVTAWMAAVLYLPRILVNLAEVGEQPAVRERLVLMGRRLYRFGHVMFGLAAIFGILLWVHFRISGGWLHFKLTLVVLVLIYYILAGRWLKAAAKPGATLPGPRTLRWLNELPLLLFIPILYLVVAKPLLAM